MRSRPGPPDRRDLPTGTEPVVVLVIRQQPVDLRVDRVPEFRSRDHAGPAYQVPETLVAEIKKLRFGSGAVKFNIAAKALPDFYAYPGREPGPQHRGTIHIAPSMAYIEKAYEQAKWGMPSSEPFIEMGVPSVVDPTIAPAGKHYISCFVQYAPYARADGRPWDQRTEREFVASIAAAVRPFCSNWF